MSRRPLVSIAVPTYNGERWIGAADRIGPGADLRAVRTRRLGRRLDRRHPGDRALLRRPADSHRRRGEAAARDRELESLGPPGDRGVRQVSPPGRHDRSHLPRGDARSRDGGSGGGARLRAAPDRARRAAGPRSTSSGPGRTQTSTKASAASSGSTTAAPSSGSCWTAHFETNWVGEPSSVLMSRTCLATVGLSTLAWSRSSTWTCGAGRCSATASASSIGSSRRTFTTVIR